VYANVAELVSLHCTLGNGQACHSRGAYWSLSFRSWERSPHVPKVLRGFITYAYIFAHARDKRIENAVCRTYRQAVFCACSSLDLNIAAEKDRSPPHLTSTSESLIPYALECRAVSLSWSSHHVALVDVSRTSHNFEEHNERQKTLLVPQRRATYGMVVPSGFG
jgi:hypothetical protein